MADNGNFAARFNNIRRGKPASGGMYEQGIERMLGNQMQPMEIKPPVFGKRISAAMKKRRKSMVA